ncbi:putative Zn-dependent peptidase [Prauserella isguenensis]|uniref:Putative Zn-dependent peptidase n=1 Tax=Prauserella isguenensis TaxID=1470180 RepID=A0A839S3T2_9PSEU|nr:putative Zn-dependent peptidase [Prauserella isguenensis]
MTASQTHRTAEEIGRTPAGPRELPQLGEQRTATPPEHVDTEIGNGLRVLAVRKPGSPMAELRMAIPFAGDDPMHTATAEVLADTIATGTRRRDRVAMDTDLALIGGDLGVAVDPEHLSVSASALATGLPTLLDVLADILTEATYADHEVEREAARLVERLAVARTQPRVIAREALQRQRYGDHPFTREVPRPEDVEQVTPGMVRALHPAAVLPRGSVLVLVGDIDPQSAVVDVERALDGWRSDDVARELPELPDLAGGDLVLVPRGGAVQSQIRLSAQSLPRTADRYPAVQLANLTFGGYFSSRLVENIREDKGYTYGAHSGFEFTRGKATVQVDADTASDVTAAALLETRYELGRLGLVPPTDSEVDTVRQYATGTLLIGSASQAGMANQLIGLAAVGLDLEWLLGHPERLAAVTTEQVAEVALEIFAPSRFTGVVVGDADVLGPQLEALGGVRVADPEP